MPGHFGLNPTLHTMFGQGDDVDRLREEQARLAQEPGEAVKGPGRAAAALSAAGDAFLTYASMLQGGPPQSTFVQNFLQQKLQARAENRERQLRERGEQIRQLDKQIDAELREREKAQEQSFRRSILEDEDRLARERMDIRARQDRDLAEAEHLRTIKFYGSKIGADVDSATSPGEALEAISRRSRSVFEQELAAAAQAAGPNAATLRQQAQQAAGLSDELTSLWLGGVDEFGNLSPGGASTRLKSADALVTEFVKLRDDAESDLTGAAQFGTIGADHGKVLLQQFDRLGYDQLADEIRMRAASANLTPRVREQIEQAIRRQDLETLQQLEGFLRLDQAGSGERRAKAAGSRKREERTEAIRSEQGVIPRFTTKF